MNIKQLNGAYLINEDRILFRFNVDTQAEYRLWLTRRVVLFILAASEHLLMKKFDHDYSPEESNEHHNLQKEGLIKTSKISSAGEEIYEAGTSFPIGFDPLLVMDVSCSLVNKGEKLPKDSKFDDVLSIDFLLPSQANLNLNLAGIMLTTMLLLLNQLRQQAEWGQASLILKNDVEANTFSGKANLQKISIH